MRSEEGGWRVACEGAGRVEVVRGEEKVKTNQVVFCLLSICHVLSRVQRASWPTVRSPCVSP